MAEWLVTLDQARAEIKMVSGQTVDDIWLKANIPIVSTRINNLTRTRFVPWQEQYFYDAFGSHIDDVYRKLDLGRPLLQPIQVIDALSLTLVQGTNYVTIPQDSPAFQLQKIDNIFGWSYGIGYGIGFWIAPIQFQRAIKVTGIWGYRTNYPAEGWTDSLQKLANNSGSINTSQTTFNVSGIGGPDANAQSPAISVGHVLQIADPSNPPNQEWMQVIGISGNVITVNRAWNGSTAYVHNDGAEVFTWSVQPEVVRGAARWLGYWYERRGAYEAVKNDLSPAGAKTYVYPDDAPAEIRAIIEQTRDWRWAAV